MPSSLKGFLRKSLKPSWKARLVKIIANGFLGGLLASIYSNKVPHFGAKINTSSRRIRRRTVADLFLGLYERVEIEQIRKYMHEEFDVIELGGSIGVASVQIAKKIRSDRKLVVVEADAELAEVILENLRLNGLIDKAQVLSVAIDYSDMPEVRFSRAESNLSGRVVDAAIGEMDSSHISVPGKRLKDIVDEFNVGDFVLVSDIEGMEIPVFVEDAEVLKKCRQILIEIDGSRYKGTEYSIDEIIQLICAQGFQVTHRYFNCVCFSR